jgi:hypothetical protein
MSDDAIRIVQEIDFLVAQRKELTAQGPHFGIIHKVQRLSPGAEPCRARCIPGEKLLGIFVVLIYRGREYPVPLSPAEALLFDFLAHFKLPMSAGQIESGIRNNPSYAAYPFRGRRAGLHRTSVKQHVRRTREALARIFREACLTSIDPAAVLVNLTVGNRYAYRLCAAFEWSHRAG